MDNQQQSPIPAHQSPVTQSPAEHKKSLPGNWRDWLYFLDKPSQWFNEFLYKAKHIPETNFDIGTRMANAGNYTDAIFRLKLCLWFMPDHQQANFMLANSYIATGDNAKAIHYMQKAVALNPSDERAVFMLATLDPSRLTPEAIPVTMPLQVALEYFNGVAENYEVMQQDAGYRAHQYADQALWDMLDRRRTNYTVLELGCGTGLCGMLLAEHAEELTGVDFARNMIEYAKNKRRPDGRRVYTETIFQDIRHYLAELRPERFDGIVAAHVLNYVGEMTVLFDNIARGLKPNGICVLQVERYYREDSFGLLQGMGRFGHGDHFMRYHFDRVGLHLLQADLVNAYPDYTIMQYVARKPEAVQE